MVTQGTMTRAPTGSGMCAIGNSKIEGVGVFAQIDIPEGFFIGTMCLYHKDTQSKSSVLYLSIISTLGRHINHQTNANCGVHNLEEREWVMVSLRDIKAGEELTVNYSLLPGEFNTDITEYYEKPAEGKTMEELLGEQLVVTENTRRNIEHTSRPLKEG